MSTEHPITTIQSALAWARRVLRGESAARGARIILAEILQARPEVLIMAPERALTIQQAAEFDRMITELSHGTPLAYLLGRQGFYDFEVTVTPDVLIPRPETELLVEKALEWAADRPVRIVDVGTGSGIIALALARHLPDAQITAVDISQAALDVARHNAERLDLAERIRWLHGDLLEPLRDSGQRFDLIVSNPPYIRHDELAALDVAKHEPLTALDGGADGLDVIRRLLDQAPALLENDGRIMLEIGWDQGAAIREMVERDFPALRVLAVDPDLVGHDRVVTVGVR